MSNASLMFQDNDLQAGQGCFLLYHGTAPAIVGFLVAFWKSVYTPNFEVGNTGKIGRM